MSGAHEAIKAITTDSSLTAGVNFGFAYWSSSRGSYGFSSWSGNITTGRASPCDNRNCLKVRVHKQGASRINQIISSVSPGGGTDAMMWARDDLYEAYLIDTLKVEPVEAALQRSIATMMDWAQEQNAQWSDYFRLVNTNRAVQHIHQGKISPWVLLGCSAGKKMLKLFTDEQLQMTQRFIIPEYWANKFKSYPADHLFVQETAKEAKIE